jgi:hypothetical protein
MDNQANPASERSSEDPMINIGEAGGDVNGLKQQLAFPRPRVETESAPVMPAPARIGLLEHKTQPERGKKRNWSPAAMMLAVIS